MAAEHEKQANARGNETINAIFASLDSIESLLTNTINFRLETAAYREMLVINRTLHEQNDTHIIIAKLDNLTNMTAELHNRTMMAKAQILPLIDISGVGDIGSRP